MSQVINNLFSHGLHSVQGILPSRPKAIGAAVTLALLTLGLDNVKAESVIGHLPSLPAEYTVIWFLSGALTLAALQYIWKKKKPTPDLQMTSSAEGLQQMVPNSNETALMTNSDTYRILQAMVNRNPTGELVPVNPAERQAIDTLIAAHPMFALGVIVSYQAGSALPRLYQAVVDSLRRLGILSPLTIETNPRPPAQIEEVGN